MNYLPSPDHMVDPTPASPLLQGAGDSFDAPDDAPMDERTMLDFEKHHCHELVQKLRVLHPQDGAVRREPVGMALSGGGTRAASFHCGVLWALADAGILKEVMHVSATSGGAYTAVSLMTHLYQMSSEAEQMGSLDDWYRHVVMRTIRRMQHNISYLVDIGPRRLFRMPDVNMPEEVGTSSFPRIFDIPLLVVSVVLSLLTSPAMVIIHTLWPTVLFIDMFHGNDLRGLWCDPTRFPWENHKAGKWLLLCARNLAWGSVASIAITAMIKLGFPRGERTPYLYLTFRSLRNVMVRLAVLYFVYNLVLMAVFGLQFQEWESAAGNLQPSIERDYVRALCHRYVADEVAAGPAVPCVDRLAGEAWYRFSGPDLYLNATWASEHARLPHGVDWDAGAPVTMPYDMSYWYTLVTSVGLTGVILTSVVALLLGSAFLKWVVTAILPISYLYVIAGVARWKIFGIITGQMLLPPWKASMYSTGLLTRILCACFCCALLTLPLYDTFMKLMHLYYRRSLKRAFFYNGRDVSSAAIVTSPYCPILHLGATVHDFRPLEERTNFCDFTLSPLYIGSRRTGFFFTPSQARLAHLMTVAGAATDASLLISLDIFAIRFLLGIVAFRFGDFLRLEPEGDTAVRVRQNVQKQMVKIGQVVQRIVEKGRIRVGLLKKYINEAHDRHWLQRWTQGMLDRMPAAIPFLICNVLLLVGTLQPGFQTVSCEIRHRTFLAAFALFFTTAIASFFAFFRPLQWLMRSPMIQQLQMTTMHIYVAPRPPPYLYVSDGGLLEVLGLLPLLRRRLKWIVVSDAAEDPNLTMRCLRELMILTRKENLCSFYDPQDPRRDFEFVIQDLPASNFGFLHIGVRYEMRQGDSPGSNGAGPSSEAEYGELFYLRMRLVPGDAAPIRSLLTEGELLKAPLPAQSSPLPGAGLRRSLGGTCKEECECGGFCAGRQFPHYSMSNQFLTPLHFANLCGLAGELCQPLVQSMIKRRASV